MGHEHTPGKLLLQKSQVLENILWVAARTMTGKTPAAQRLVEFDGEMNGAIELTIWGWDDLQQPLKVGNR